MIDTAIGIIFLCLTGSGSMFGLYVVVNGVKGKDVRLVAVGLMTIMAAAIYSLMIIDTIWLRQ